LISNDKQEVNRNLGFASIIIYIKIDKRILGERGFGSPERGRGDEAWAVGANGLRTIDEVVFESVRIGTELSHAIGVTNRSST
jgi:hypothetical protein